MLDIQGFSNRLQYSGDSHWFPRDDKLRTPPGPEGSNGSNGLGCRGVADVDRLQFDSSPHCISLRLQLSTAT